MNIHMNGLEFCPDAEREPVDFSQLQLLHSHYIL